jgi:hypothetical protein
MCDVEKFLKKGGPFLVEICRLVPWCFWMACVFHSNNWSSTVLLTETRLRHSCTGLHINSQVGVSLGLSASHWQAIEAIGSYLLFGSHQTLAFELQYLCLLFVPKRIHPLTSLTWCRKINTVQIWLNDIQLCLRSDIIAILKCNDPCHL